MKNTTISRIRNAVSLSMRQCYLGFLVLFALTSVTGFAQGTIGIGSGTATNQNVPINSCMGYNYSQQIVTAAEYGAGGGVAGNITKIRYYFAAGTTTFANFNNWTIYVGHTAKTQFSSNTDWEPVTNLTQVYSGTITPVANTWMEITFTTPFNYNGTSNLIVAVDENVPSWDCTANWGSYTSGTNTAIYYNVDAAASNPNPASPPSATGRTNIVARLQFVGQQASCLAPSGVTASAATTTTGNINWTASTSAPSSGYEYYYSTSATAPVAATTPSGSVAAGVLTASISGLTANSTYNVWVRSNCGAGSLSSWSPVTSFTTPCDATSVTYTQNFESVVTPAIPACTTIQNAGTGNMWYTSANPGSGFTTNVLRYSWNGTNAANAWFFTQGINMTAGTSYRVTYKYGNNSTFYIEKLKVSYGTANNAAAMTTTLATHNSVTGGVPTTTFVDFIPATTGVYYIGFNAFSIADQDQLYLDDISVTVTPTCQAPTALTATALSANTASATWTASTSVPSLGYDYYLSTTNTAPTAATAATGNVATGTTASLTGLTANTTYYVWVRAKCTASDSSAWTASATFTTLCDAFTAPFLQAFSAGSLPSCWTTTSSNPVANGLWKFTGVVDWAPGNTRPNGTFAWVDGSDPSTINDVTLTSPLINLAGLTVPELVFDYFSNNTNTNPNNIFKVDVFNGTTWTNVYTNNTSSANWRTINVSLAAYANTSIRIRFVVDKTAAPVGFAFYNDILLDQVIVQETPTCPGPTGVTAAAASLTSGTVSWTAASAAPALGYEYYYSATNTAPTAATAASGSVANTATTATISGLTTGTTYYVWVRSSCSATDKGVWTGPASFNPNYCTPAPSSQDGTGITNVVLGTINNPSGSESATAFYGNYSALSTSAALGSTVNFAITYSTGFTYGTKIWVDWNNDADFTDAGELVYTGLSTNANPTTLTGSFVVPANAALVGSHRVRIGGTDTDTGGDPCYTGAWGTYEDYTINAFMPPAPVVTGFTPASYCAASGDITITGTDIGNATALTIGGTAVPITTNTATQIVATVPAGVSGVVAVTTVAGTGTTATSFSVTQPTPLVLSDGAEVLCLGESTPVITITSGASAFDTYVWTPSTGVSGNATNGWVITPTETTTYMLTASQSAGPCVVMVEYVATVNPLPQAVTVTPAADDVCLNSIVTLTANGGESIIPTAYCTTTTVNGGASGDFINNFTFANITNNASGDAASDYTYYPALTANLTGGSTYNVSIQGGSATWAQGFRIWIDYNHDGTFAATESVFSSAASTAVQTGTVVIPATALNGVTRMRVLARYNATPAAADACDNPGFGEYEDYNVNITGATNPVNYVWAPTAGLFTDAAGTVAYTGTPAQTVYAMITSTTTTTYSATASTPLGCSISGTTVLTTTNTPAPTGAAMQMLCSGAMVSDLSATGTAIQWYTSATGGQSIAATAMLSNGMYYATQTANGCESTQRLAVNVMLTVIPAPTVGDDVQVFCNAGTVGELMANGTAVQWYSSATGGQAIDPATALPDGVTVYYGSQTVDGCESPSRVAVASLVNVYSAPIVLETEQMFCAGSGATVADLDAIGQGILWYADMTSTTPLAADTVLESGVTYYASQTILGCESAERVGVMAMFNVTAAPMADAAQYFCNAGTVGGLMADGSNVQWYADMTGGEALAANTALVDGTPYYASQTIDGCEGTDRAMVTAYVSVIAVPMAEATQEIEENVQGTATIADIEVTGDNVVWYASEEDAITGINPLGQGTLLESGATYYATQTVDGCTSAPFGVTVTVALGRDGFNAAAFKYYPNPVKDVLNLSYSADITSVTVYNLLGQQVLAKDVNATSATLDMTVLQDGTYIVNVTSGDAVQTIKIVKKQ